MLLKVQLPNWWTEVNYPVYGYTDALDTFCCSASPAWWVVVPPQPQFQEIPDFEYEGYFYPHDLKRVPIDQNESAHALETFPEFDY